jgi:hypothetical protein
LRQVAKLASECGVAPGGYKLAKLQAKTGKRSQAWKSFERAIAELAQAHGFAAERISRGADLGASDIDVRLPKVPELRIDCKYRQDGFSHHSLFEGAENLYCQEPGQWLALPTKAGQATGSLVTLRSEKFFELLARAYAERTDAVHGWACPRCQHPTQLRTTYGAFGLAEQHCEHCALIFWVPLAALPASLSDTPDTFVEVTLPEAV